MGNDDGLVFDNVVRAHVINGNLQELREEVFAAPEGSNVSQEEVLFSQERLVRLCDLVQDVLMRGVRPAPEDLEHAVQTLHHKLQAKDDEVTKIKKKMQSLSLKYETIIDHKNLELEGQRNRVISLSEKVEYLSARVEELTIVAAAAQKKKKGRRKGKKKVALSLDENMLKEGLRQSHSARASPRVPQPPTGSKTERAVDPRRKILAEKAVSKQNSGRSDPLASDDDLLELLDSMPIQERTLWLEDICNIYALSNTVTAELGIEATVLSLEERCCKLLRAHGATVYMVDEDKSEIFTYRQSGLNAQRKTFSFKNGIAGQVADSCRGVKIDRDASHHSRFSVFVDKPPLCDKVESLLCRPIVDGTGRLVGVIEVVRSDQDRPFARDEDLLLRFLALQAAISLRSGEVIDSVGAMQSKMQDYEKRYLEADEGLRLAEARLRTTGQLTSSLTEDAAEAASETMEGGEKEVSSVAAKDEETEVAAEKKDSEEEKPVEIPVTTSSSVVVEEAADAHPQL